MDHNHTDSECGICHECMLKNPPMDPRFLSCYHTFCARCLKQLLKNCKIICPLCNTVTPNVGNIHSDLKSNKYILKLKESEEIERQAAEIERQEIALKVRERKCQEEESALEMLQEKQHFRKALEKAETEIQIILFQITTLETKEHELDKKITEKEKALKESEINLQKRLESILWKKKNELTQESLRLRGIYKELLAKEEKLKKREKDCVLKLDKYKRELSYRGDDDF